jgi:hypothetical protein
VTAAAGQLCAASGSCGNEALAGLKATYDPVPANNAALAAGYDTDSNNNLDVCFYEGPYNVPKACTLSGFATDGSTAETTIDVGNQLHLVCEAGNTIMTYTAVATGLGNRVNGCAASAFGGCDDSTSAAAYGAGGHLYLTAGASAAAGTPTPTQVPSSAYGLIPTVASLNAAFAVLCADNQEGAHVYTGGAGNANGSLNTIIGLASTRQAFADTCNSSVLMTTKVSCEIGTGANVGNLLPVCCEAIAVNTVGALITLAGGPSSTAAGALGAGGIDRCHSHIKTDPSDPASTGGGCSSTEATLNTLQPAAASGTAAATHLCAASAACGQESLVGLKATYDPVPANNAALAAGYDTDSNTLIDMCFAEGPYVPTQSRGVLSSLVGRGTVSS